MILSETIEFLLDFIIFLAVILFVLPALSILCGLFVAPSVENQFSHFNVQHHSAKLLLTNKITTNLFISIMNFYLISTLNEH